MKKSTQEGVSLLVFGVLIIGVVAAAIRLSYEARDHSDMIENSDATYCSVGHVEAGWTTWGFMDRRTQRKIVVPKVGTRVVEKAQECEL